MRKNVKDSDDKGGEADIGVDDVGAGAGAPVAGPSDGMAAGVARKAKKTKIGLPWEVGSLYGGVEVPEKEGDEEGDEEEEEMNYATLQRLKKADERTKAMSKEEYVTWSEYRQASFTFRKAKRFKEWAGFGTITDSKPNDDIVDILGFLTFEIVQTLTEEALKIKEQEDLYREKTGVEVNIALLPSHPVYRLHYIVTNSMQGQGKKRKSTFTSLFDPPTEGRTPVESKHIQEAFRRLQARPKKYRAMLNGTRGVNRTPLKLF